MDAPALDVRPFFGAAKAELWALGTYAGHERSGFDEWHDPAHADADAYGRVRKPKTTAALCFNGATVNGVAYQGRIDFKRNQHSGVWEVHYPSWIRREPHGGDPTDKARAELKAQALAILQSVEQLRPTFFTYHGELYALTDERERWQMEARRHRNEADNCDEAAAALQAKIDELDKRALVAQAAEAVEAIDADELERYAAEIRQGVRA